MRALLGKILAVALGLYMLIAMAAVPYFNWRYAQEHGFMRWLLLGEFIATAKGFAWPYFVATHFYGVEALASKAGEDSPREYVDHQHQFGFQFPADWGFERNPPPGEAGEVRAIVRHPTKPMRVVATVGHIGKSLTKQQFESSSNRDAAVAAMMELSVEQVYKKTSRDIGAERMIVSEKQEQPSEVGIRFYISTGHIKSNATILMAGIHTVPFGKPYMITFTMIAPVDRTATTDNDIITRIFNSFHLLGERPIR